MRGDERRVGPENLDAVPYDELRARGLETLPPNLLEATNELKGNDVIRKALGRGRDEDYIDYFVRVKQAEFKLAHEQINRWELDRYLQLF